MDAGPPLNERDEPLTSNWARGLEAAVELDELDFCRLSGLVGPIAAYVVPGPLAGGVIGGLVLHNAFHALDDAGGAPIQALLSELLTGRARRVGWSGRWGVGVNRLNLHRNEEDDDYGDGVADEIVPVPTHAVTDDSPV